MVSIPDSYCTKKNFELLLSGSGESNVTNILRVFHILKIIPKVVRRQKYKGRVISWQSRLHHMIVVL